MTFAWLPYPFAGHFKMKRFRNREAALKFIDMTVPYLCQVHVRIVNLAEWFLTSAAIALVLLAIVAGGSR